MELKNYSLGLKSKVLLQDVTVSFERGRVNHILGKNGTGKSQFAKDLLLNKQGNLPQSLSEKVSVIASYSNLPEDLKVARLYQLLQKKFGEEAFSKLAELLKLDNIDPKLLVKKLSDGQKQKLKILAFFLENKEIIILDELTNALDKATVLDLYGFLGNYSSQNPQKTILNITHNLSDLNHLPGNYYLLADQTIEKIASVEEIKERYVNE